MDRFFFLQGIWIDFYQLCVDMYIYAVGWASKQLYTWDKKNYDSLPFLFCISKDLVYVYVN